ncbi:bifunctional 3,4-dihydroxy-2-butanone-4-phosphate synthase/GTP cyclohydrolase II, partial [Staphylococcus aureus]
INLMAKEASELICAPVSKDIAQRLDLVQMVDDNSDIFGTQFTVSIDHVDTTTGISSYELTFTAKTLIDPSSEAKDLNRPGHLFPLVAQEKGVLVRNGHT